MQIERLKDFSENIVESLNIGVVTVDLQDRIESWNSQMEVMYALPRSEVLGQRLSQVFPSTFMGEFVRVRRNPGIHNLYKFRLTTPAGDARIASIRLENSQSQPQTHFNMGDAVSVIVRVNFSRTIQNPTFGITISTETGITVADCRSSHYGLHIGAASGEVPSGSP